tara:strand:- start:896 stop:1882 length:987 start_codon:yes stop_codon:yes gene_type:complete
MLFCLQVLVVLLVSLWALPALWYHRPHRLLLRFLPLTLWLLLMTLVLVFASRGEPMRAALSFMAGFAPLLLWWRGVMPKGNCDWADDMAYTTTGVVDGNSLRLQRVRCFDWRSDTDYQIRWESREYALSQLRSVDMLTSFWGHRSIAHMLISFGFSDGRYLAWSVEIRRVRDEEYSAIAGFFKHFELNIVASEETDIVKVRSNHRGEDMYLYRTRLSPAAGRQLLLGYVEAANRLAVRPRFYHTLRANCTNVVFILMKRIRPDLRSDIRLLLSGYLDSYVYAQGGLQKPWSLAELRRLGRITERARDERSEVPFSRRIRQGVPGCEND